MNQKEKNMDNKNQKDALGITLVALVVTIVVLLILAGVSINLLFGDNGIIQKAQLAREKSKQGIDNDIEEIDKISNWLNETLNQSTGEEEEEQVKWLYEERVAGEYVITGIDFSDFSVLSVGSDLSTNPKSVAPDARWVQSVRRDIL